MGNCCCRTRGPGFWNAPNAPPSTNTCTDWMKALDLSKSIANISIPGTHETMASTTGIPWVMCQSLSLGVQLQIGIRFFDIRCSLYTNELLIYHSKFYLHSNFTQCLTDMSDFLNKHPTEFLVVRVREENHPPIDSNISFCKAVRDTLENYKAHIWSEETVPIIEQAKGKIIILYDFPKDDRTPIGIPYRSLKIEDMWNVKSFPEKWKAVQNNLERATSIVDKQIYLTYNSTTINIDTPCYIARELNPKLYDYLKGKHGRFGIIAMDYPGPKLVEEIINTNNED